MARRRLGMLSAIALSLGLGGSPWDPAPDTASADGALLHWDSCSPPANPGSATKTFACDTNEGYSDLVVGFYLDNFRSFTIGLEAELEIGGGDRYDGGTWTEVDYDPLPSYWRLQSGGCRSGEGTVSFDYLAAPNCIDAWRGAPGSPDVTITYPYRPSPGATPRLRIAISGTWPERTMGLGEYFAFRVRVTRAGSTGAGACDGCCLPMTAHVTGMRIPQSNGFTLAIPTIGADTVVWNESASPFCGVTEARNSTWGSIKGLYR